MPARQSIWAQEQFAHGEIHAFLNKGVTDFDASQFTHDSEARLMPETQSLVGGGGWQEVNESGGDVIPGDIGTGFTLSLGVAETGTINGNPDNDYFRVTMVAGQSYVFNMSATGGGLDCYLELRDSTGALLAIDDDAGAGTDSMLRYTATTSGTYFINARPYRDTGQTSSGTYNITFNTGPAQNPLDTINLHYTAPIHIDVYFATTGQTFQGDVAARNWTASEITQAMAALQVYSTYTNLTFSQTSVQGDAEFILTLDTDIGANVLGHFLTVSGIGYGAFNPGGSGWTTGTNGAGPISGLLPGGLGFVTLIHEFGHGLGLAHPHDNGGDSEIMQGVTESFDSFGTFNMNQGVFTTMSYNDSWNTGPGGFNASVTTGDQATPGPIDVALLQQRYGANTSTNSGNTVYTLTGAAGTYVAIWDVSGTDSIQYGGSENTNIDLRAASLLNETGGGGWVSYAGVAHSGFTIANGVVIENASSGFGNDTLIGNEANNTLSASEGTDTLFGNGGNDTLIGGIGNDAINGGLGIDTANYSVTAASSNWHRNPDGTWTVSASGLEGTDSTSSVEFLHFTDRDVFLDRAYSTFSGDGTSDIFMRHSSGAMGVWFVNGAGVTGAAGLGGLDLSWNLHGVGDFNGDGRDDILWRNTSGDVGVWFMNGGAATGGGLGNIPTNWAIEGLGDFNGDGRDDILMRDQNGNVGVWFINGTSATGAGLGNVDHTFQVAAIGDYNGDGRDDILWWNDNGSLGVWFMNGSSVSGALGYGGITHDWILNPGG